MFVLIYEISAWHTAGEYTYLCSDYDMEMLQWITRFKFVVPNFFSKQFNLNLIFVFSKFDLYSKCEDLPDVEKLENYYQGLIDKYIPGKLKW